MEPVLTPEEMGAADEATIRGGTPSAVLMERAAYACATVGIGMIGGAYGRRAVVACGKGNNGGDGIACARHLGAAGMRVDAFLMGDPSGDPAHHLELARLCTPSVRFRDWSAEAFERTLGDASLVVDAIFGTGFSGAPRGAPGEAISALSDPPCPVLAVDIPSGVSGADGSIPGAALSADVTVAIQALKVGHVVDPGAMRCGRLDVADIDIDVSGDVALRVPEPSDVSRVLPEAAPDAHKYRTGVLAVLAGSAGMTGAAVLVASGALRAGAGLVLLGVPQTSLQAVEGAVAEAVKVPLPASDGRFDPKAVDHLQPRLEKAGALAVGPGLGRDPGTVELVRRVLDLPLPVVCDADALWALGRILPSEPDVLHRREHAVVLTPHAGEFAMLRDPGDDRLASVRDAARELGAVVHLKGHRALTASPDGRVWVNPTGNPGLATGGAGDVLTGVIGTLASRGMDAADATWAGAYLHGLAGDVAAARSGRPSLVAGDLPGALGTAFRRIAASRRPTGRIRTVLGGDW